MTVAGGRIDAISKYVGFVQTPIMYAWTATTKGSDIGWTRSGVALVYIGQYTIFLQARHSHIKREAD